VIPFSTSVRWHQSHVWAHGAVDGLIFSLASQSYVKVLKRMFILLALGATSHSLPCAPIEPHFICALFVLSEVGT